MQNTKYFPEGALIRRAENTYLTQTESGIEQAFSFGHTVEGLVCRCDAEHNLYIRIGENTVFIPRDETAMGITEGTVRDIAILTRVGKPVCFRFEDISGLKKGGMLLGSRRAVQENCLNHLLSDLSCGDIIDVRVTHLEKFGCFVDLGCGCMSMIGADRISVSRIRHTCERFRVGQQIRALVVGVDKNLRRISLSHRELLGTWEENASLFTTGETVEGIVRGVESYGTFIELTPNLSGLAEPAEGIENGDRVAVFVKNICPERMKVKLLIIDRIPGEFVPPEPKYFVSQAHLETFVYAPKACRIPGKNPALFSANISAL